MDLKKTCKIPVSAIVLDTVGTIMLSLGIIGLLGIPASFMGSLTVEPQQAWTLIVFGVVFMIAATMLIVAALLASRNCQEPSATDRHQQ